MWKTALIIGTLPDFEGDLFARGQRRGSEVSENTLLGELMFAHGDATGPCSELSFVRVSDAKGALKCERCGLRVPLPGKVRTAGDLRKYLASIE